MDKQCDMISDFSGVYFFIGVRKEKVLGDYWKDNGPKHEGMRL